MNGTDYIAAAQLTDKSGDVLAAPGEACDRVPATSLPWLLEQGYIVARNDAERREDL